MNRLISISDLLREHRRNEKPGESVKHVLCNHKKMTICGLLLVHLLLQMCALMERVQSLYRELLVTADRAMWLVLLYALI